MANWLLDKLGDIVPKRKEAYAVSSRGLSLTFLDFYNAVYNCATSLRERGLTKGDTCVILCDSSINSYIYIYATWALGAVYCPISRETPTLRNDYIIEQTRAKIIVVPAHTVTFPFSNKFNRLVFSPSFVSFADKEPDFVYNDISAEDIAYILFTSGTTGHPKGVMISHGNLKNLHAGLIEDVYSAYPTHMKVAQVAPFTFDASLQQIVSPVLLGHTTYIVQDNQRHNPKLLWSFLKSNGINLFDCTPTHIKMLNTIIEDSSIDYSTLNGILVGGEALNADTVYAFARKFKVYSPDFINVYGVTECTVDSVVYRFNPKLVFHSDVIPIGRAMHGCSTTIVDDNGNVCEKNTTGELLIGGSGVGLGYLDTSLNDGRFIGDHLNGNVFYRTGDLAFTDDNGLIVCVGRADRQVKIRGNRVELPEIESCLMKFRTLTHNVIGCKRCLLNSSCTSVDDNGICDICHLSDKHEADLKRIFDEAGTLENLIIKHPEQEYDCLLLYSGGKDSTYVLLKLISSGYRVLAYTFDNGYLSQQALQNIKAVTASLGVKSIIETFPDVDLVFKESLNSFSTVCDGCYKVLMTLSTKSAIEHNIPCIVSGLNRGQIIETKLRPLLQRNICVDIDGYLSEQRKVYHFWDDHFSHLIPMPGTPEQVDKIRFIDYFLCDDVSDDDILSYIEKSGYWKKSIDTGLCSTNCMINDVGIYAFYCNYGYHNYAPPLSWDIRLGRITRQEGLTRTSISGLDIAYIESELDKFEFVKKVDVENAYVVLRNGRLVAFVQSKRELKADDLKNYVKRELPLYMVPNQVIILKEFPTLENGKVDSVALNNLLSTDKVQNDNDAKENPYVQDIARMWAELLGHSDFGPDDSFFDVGGDSLEAVMITAQIEKKYHCSINFDEIMYKLTINDLATQVLNNRKE